MFLPFISRRVYTFHATFYHFWLFPADFRSLCLGYQRFLMPCNVNTASIKFFELYTVKNAHYIYTQLCNMHIFFYINPINIKIIPVDWCRNSLPFWSLERPLKPFRWGAEFFLADCKKKIQTRKNYSLKFCKIRLHIKKIDSMTKRIVYLD